MEDDHELTRELQLMVDRYGLSVVHDTLQSMFEYCENCGCPDIEGEYHSPFNLGSCYIRKESTR